MSFFLNIEQPLRVIIENHETFFEWITQPSSIVALSAVFVSIAGLLLTAGHNRITLRKQEDLNARTVEPELTLRGTLEVEDDEKKAIHSQLIIINTD